MTRSATTPIALSDKDIRCLDDPVRFALTGSQARFAVPANGPAYRFRPEIGPFAALDDPADDAGWHALGELCRIAEPVVLVAPVTEHPLELRPGWQLVAQPTGYQLLAPPIIDTSRPDSELVPLTAADVPEMLALVELTRPGPFGPATIELGGYLGIRREGRLVAMAGRRFELAGWSEISAVCTHPDFRGQGLSRRLITAVLAELARDGQRGFLHVTRDNVGADALYRSMGFTQRAEVAFTVLRRWAGNS
ncbi:MAG TPA: GNAT family N-acetyltransferase [Jatrophihabitans sp.]|nr:GNAT family N-acetyltransferase [Jatrophihabitans sp.]